MRFNVLFLFFVNNDSIIIGKTLSRGSLGLDDAHFDLTVILFQWSQFNSSAPETEDKALLFQDGGSILHCADENRITCSTV